MQLFTARRACVFFAGLALGWCGSALVPIPAAQAGFQLDNLDGIVRVEMESLKASYSWHLHREVEGLDSQSPDLSEAQFDEVCLALSEDGDIADAIATTDAADWWESLSTERQLGFETLTRALCAL